MILLDLKELKLFTAVDCVSLFILVGEPKLRIMQKHKKNAPERYTAGFLYMECLNTG